MNEIKTVLELDELLPLLIPCDDPHGEKKSFSPTPPKREEAEDLSLHKEVPLSLCLRTENGLLEVKGIACAISGSFPHYILSEELILSDEDDFGGARREQALLRARFLALALCNTKKLEQIRIRLAVFSRGEWAEQHFVWEKEELSALLRRFAPRILSLAPLWEKRESKIQFPFSPLRQGQKQLIHAAWDAIKHKTKLYACAPTGIGKTLAVLYPAMKALETGKAKRVFYASPKNTLKMQAAAAAEQMQAVKGFRILVLSARMALCPNHREECLRQDCEFFQQFSEKLPDALAFLSAFSCVTEKELSEAAAKYGICPFRLAVAYQKYCSVVIGDYNHLLDPSRALFAPDGESILLIDEAHNLPARIRESFSETLAPSDLDFFFQDPSSVSAMLREHFASLSAQFARIDKERNESRRFHSFDPPENLAKIGSELAPKLGFALHGGFGTPAEDCEKALKELLKKLRRFAALTKGYNEAYATVYPPEGGVRIYPVDPRELIADACRGWRSVIFFSATLAPQEYFFNLLAGEEQDRFLTLASPFERDHLFVGLVDVDVSFSRRFETAPKICSIIRSAISSRKGNYMVFLPGFEYLRLVSQEFKKQNFTTQILVQKKNMSRKERDSFLQAFQSNREKTLVGFCVLGGVFAEGIDLKGDSLSGEIIVGTGFPPPSPEAEAESEAYYKREMDGKSFAYTLPGWNRVLQAAGRVIRSEEDRGFLILCDSRYCTEEIKELFPAHWEQAEILERDSELKEKLRLFWGNA